jgi:Kdo2-lipid IVA lauroyltransferase/acyltransferase
MPLENKIFDRIFLQFRAKTGSIMLSATDMRNAILPWRGEQYVLGLIADQNPAWPSNAYWINFFGRPTPFLRAPENGARIGNLPVIFSHFTKLKRGYYEGSFIIGEDDPASLEKGELTKKYVRYLEDVITKHPEMWLWSHRRWKWEWKPEYGEIID